MPCGLQRLLRDNLPFDAIMALVRGCTKSAFCLALLQDSAHDLSNALQKCRDKCRKDFGVDGVVPHAM